MRDAGGLTKGAALQSGEPALMARRSTTSAACLEYQRIIILRCMPANHREAGNQACSSRRRQGRAIVAAVDEGRKRRRHALLLTVLARPPIKY